jgi:CO/xanthine dehydrogenase Mo-binding subunit
MTGGRIEIHTCTQAPVMDLDAFEDLLAMDRVQIRIIPKAVGGKFASKLDIMIQPLLGLAAIALRKPVRLNYSRVFYRLKPSSSKTPTHMGHTGPKCCPWVLSAI